MGNVVFKKRNMSLSILEGIACICVVMIHFPFPGDIGMLLHGASNFAVPLFFAVSGYFVYNEDTRKVIRSLPRKIKHIAGIFLGTEILYFGWHVLWGGVEWLRISFTIKNIVNFVVFQTTFIGNVSWFLVALLMCYGVTFLIAKYNFWKKCIGFIPLLCVNILLGRVGLGAGIEIPWYWCSNFWFLGFPCYIIGFLIRIYEKKFIRFLTSRRCFLLIGSTGISSIVEVAIIGGNQCCISNILFTVFCFMSCLKYPEYFKENGIMRYLDYVGENYSLGVYILHPLAGGLISTVAGIIGLSGMIIWKWSFPIIVVIFSMFIWKLWRAVINICRFQKRL